MAGEIIFRRAARFEMSVDLLRMLLGLPKDTKILYVESQPHGTVMVCVEQKDPPLIREDQELPLITPLFGHTVAGNVKLLDWRVAKPPGEVSNDEAKGN